MSAVKEHALAFVRHVLAPGVAAFALFAFAYEIWSADFRMPWQPLQGDFAQYAAMIFKGLAENPWYLHNDSLGAPLGLDLYDYPTPDLLLLAVVKLGTFFTKNPFLVMNVVFAASFPLVAIVTAYALRRLGARAASALAASLVYAMLAYHHMRGVGHVFLSAGYWTVPLAVVVAVDIMRGTPFLFVRRESRLRLALGAPGTRFALGVAGLVGLTGLVYYPFFSVFCLLVAGGVGALRGRCILPLARAVALSGIVAIGLLVNLAPTIGYHRSNGSASLLEREPSDAEIFGLKISHMVLPVPGHRIDAVMHFRERYDAKAPLSNENVTAALGVAASVGFLYLLASLLVAREKDERVHALSVLSLACVVLGTIGGVGALVAFAVAPNIRGYNRISVYIAFCGLAAVALLLDRAAARLARPRSFAVLLAVFALVAVFDEVPRGLAAVRRVAKDSYERERGLVARMEAALPPGASVFQLPYVAFPENGRVNGLEDYTMLRPYLVARGLRFSHGAMRGRRADDWSQKMAARPTRELVDALSYAGFSGIHVTRDALPDRGAALDAELSALLGPALTSEGGGTAFYSLVAHASALRAHAGDAAWEAKREEVLSPPYLGFRDGFYPPRITAQDYSVFCRSRGEVTIENPSRAPVRLVFDMYAKSGGPDTYVLRIRGPLLTRDVAIPAGEPKRITETLEVPPGAHRLVFEHPGPPSPWDARDVRFVLWWPQLRSPDVPPP